MQQLLNTTRQLTLGPYKHETECECFPYLHSTWDESYSSSNHANESFSCRAGVTNTRKGGSGEEEDEPGDRRAEGATESLQRKHQRPEGRDTQTGGGRPDEGSLRRTSDGTWTQTRRHQNLCEYLTAFWTVLTAFCMNKTVLQILSDYCPVLFKHLVSSSFTENDPLKPIMKYQICMYNII